MTRYQLKTLNSVYQIEENEDGSGTWHRVETTPNSGEIRSTSAEFSSHSPIVFGQSATFVGRPFDETKDPNQYRRFLITSPVIQIIPEDGTEVIDG